MFEGTYTALITPFTTDDGIDYPALKQLIDAQIAAGVQGVVPCGSTGESATLSHDEHERVIAATVEHVAGRIRVIAGTGSNSTRESLRLTRWAKEHGADGALLIAPYYNKPTQDGLRAHYETVANGVDMPLIVYNIPGRSAVNIAPETMAKLADVPHIVGVKEASGSLDQISRTIQMCGPKLTVLSGDDSLTLPIMSVGGRGVIAVISNLVPDRLRRLVDAALAGDYASAREQHYALLPLMQALGVETNPIPIKAALGMLGQCSAELRLPLTSLREENVAAVRRGLQMVGLPA